MINFLVKENKMKLLMILLSYFLIITCADIKYEENAESGPYWFCENLTRLMCYDVFQNSVERMKFYENVTCTDMDCRKVDYSEYCFPEGT